MKAAIWSNYGNPEVLKIEEIDIPEFKPNEILIKIVATTVTAGDCEVRSFSFPLFMWLPLRLVFGLFKPRKKILGQEISGTIDKIGSEITKFKVGDQVFAATLFKLGGYTEYVALPEKYPIHKIPEILNFKEAATLPTGGINALHFIKIANVKPGESVLLNGAGGSIGTYATQILKVFDAEVTCVDRKEKLGMLKDLGADHLIDFQTNDFTKNTLTYDVIIDIVGKSSYSGSLNTLKAGGRYILGNPKLSGMIRGIFTNFFGNKRVISKMADYRPEYFTELLKLIAECKVKPIIGHEYDLEQIVEAHHFVETGMKKGNLVVNV